MSYVTWALVAMGAYGVTTTFLKVGLRHFPPEVALVITNSILVVVALGLVAYRRATVATELAVGWPVLYLVAAGLALSLSIASYYVALSRGPVTVVAPIFALSFAVASVLGIIFLGEEIKLTRVLGLTLAAGSIFLLAR